MVLEFTRATFRETSRRYYLTAAISSAGIVAGCIGVGNERDSDGDGVSDDQDYAPNDPQVQAKSDLEDGDTLQANPDDESNGGSDSNANTDTETATATQTFEFPSHEGEHRITGGDDYWFIELSIPRPFVLKYTVRNLESDERDFDVFVFDESEFEDYQTRVSGGLALPDAINKASSENVKERASRTVQLSQGTYYFVVDNTDIGDAGDFGGEDPRVVKVTLTTQAA